MDKQLKKRKYHPPKLQKHETLKTVTQGVTWAFNGTCLGYDANKGACVYGYDCE